MIVWLAQLGSKFRIGWDQSTTMANRRNYYQLTFVYFLALLVVVSLADDSENEDIEGQSKEKGNLINGRHLRISASQVTKQILFPPFLI